MKKLIVLIGSLLLIVLMLFSLSSCSKVEIEASEIVAVFRYGDADITKPMSDKDSEIVREMFNGKNLYSDSPSCGFSENVALIIDGAPYCVACDDCVFAEKVNPGQREFREVMRYDYNKK